MNNREALRSLAEDGRLLQLVTGSHHQFRHPAKPGLVTVPHPKRDLPVGTVRSIELVAADGDPIPDPMSLSAALADPDFSDGVPILVQVQDDVAAPRAV